MKQGDLVDARITMRCLDFLSFTVRFEQGTHTVKKMILIALIGFGAWTYYSKQPPLHSSAELDQLLQSVTNTAIDRPAPARATTATTGFKCDGRQYCSQMNSRAEAVFFTRNCPNTKMDGDRDGIPCENDSRF